MTAHQPRKRFGQNFLTDESVIESIIQAIAPNETKSIVEIGPGLGALTQELLPLVKTLEVIELDRDIIPQLQKRCAGLGQLHIHNTDVLQFDFGSLIKSNERLTIVGNLPYNISTPLLFHLTQYYQSIETMIFMLQREVVDRLCAIVGTKAYGRLTVMLQYYFYAEKLFEVPPEAFNPKPKVDSAMVQLTPRRPLPFKVNDYKMLERLVQSAFNLRRKTIANGLKPFMDAKRLESLGINSTLRPEQLSLSDFVRIANAE